LLRLLWHLSIARQEKKTQRLYLLSSANQTIPLPPFAYVPGESKRHDENTFDAIRNSVAAGMSESELTDSTAFKAGLLFLQHGYYWEAHEVLEAVWMVAAPNSAARSLVQGLIQVANAKLKARMGRASACVRLCDIADQLFLSIREQRVMGIAVSDWRADISALKQAQRVQYNANNQK